MVIILKSESPLIFLVSLTQTQFLNLKGCVVDEPFVVVRDGDYKLQAFYNVCRHHASRLVESGLLFNVI